MTASPVSVQRPIAPRVVHDEREEDRPTDLLIVE